MIITRRNFIYSTAAVSLFPAFMNAYAAGVNGSGIPGSPEMLKFEALWKKMNESMPKQIGRERFNNNKYLSLIHI